MESTRINEFLKIMQMLHKNGQRFRTENGIPHTEFHVLQYLVCREDRTEGVSIADLTEHVQISKPAVSQLINSMEEKGLVERVTTKKDRRVVLVTITDAGVALMQEKRKGMNAKIEAILEKMGDEDAAAFLKLFDKFAQIMSEI